MTYWENYPLLHSNPNHISFEKDLHECIRLSEENINPDHKEEYLLANLCARGMLLIFYADNDLVMEVIPLAASTYKYIRRSFDYASACNDLYYFTGIYNYYREAYPREYPLYKSLAILFPGGDLETGLKELHTAALKSVVLKGESYFLLNWIYLNYENNYPEALSYGKTLHELYPDNVLFLAVYLKNLLLLKQYDESEKLINEATRVDGNRYLRDQLTIFNGLVQEKKYHNYDLAQQYYKEGISNISFFGGYGNEYTAYAYYGLGRISKLNGEKDISKSYVKQAMKLAEFKKINFDK